MSKWRTLQGPVSDEEEKALNMILSVHEKKLVNPICFYCEINEGITLRFEELTCLECKGDDIRMINDPRKERLLTERQKAVRLKSMLLAFKDAFSEDEEEVRGLPVNRTTDEPRTPEDEELFKSLIQTMCEVGRRAKKSKGEK